MQHFTSAASDRIGQEACHTPHSGSYNFAGTGTEATASGWVGDGGWKFSASPNHRGSLTFVSAWRAGPHFVEQQNSALALALGLAPVHHTVTRPVKLRRGARAYVSFCLG